MDRILENILFENMQSRNGRYMFTFVQNLGNTIDLLERSLPHDKEDSGGEKQKVRLAWRNEQ